MTRLDQPLRQRQPLRIYTEVCVSVQIKEGNGAAHKAKRGVRQAVIQAHDKPWSPNHKSVCACRSRRVMRLHTRLRGG